MYIEAMDRLDIDENQNEHGFAVVSIVPLNPAWLFQDRMVPQFCGIDLRQREAGSQCFSDAKIDGTAGSSCHDGLGKRSNKSPFVVSSGPLACRISTRLAFR
jgi:hypothetical protein